MDRGGKHFFKFKSHVSVPTRWNADNAAAKGSRCNAHDRAARLAVDQNDVGAVQRFGRCLWRIDGKITFVLVAGHRPRSRFWLQQRRFHHTISDLAVFVHLEAFDGLVAGRTSFAIVDRWMQPIVRCVVGWRGDGRNGLGRCVAAVALGHLFFGQWRFAACLDGQMSCQYGPRLTNGLQRPQ